MTTAEKIGAWVLIESIDGGWVVRCRLCGKQANRVFQAANTNYAAAEAGSSAYAEAHMVSDAHKAAIDVFHSDEVPVETLTKEEKLLQEIFGERVEAPRSEYLTRLTAARGAAARMLRAEKKAAVIVCAVCGNQVSADPERHVVNGDGDKIHPGCVA